MRITWDEKREKGEKGEKDKKDEKDNKATENYYHDKYIRTDKNTNANLENLKYKGESLVPVLVKAIQELNADFQSYKNSHP